MKKRLSRMQLLEIKEIICNYNMGFLTKAEYNCQIIGVITWDSDKEQRLWHLACLLPDWVHNLIFNIRLFFEK